MLPTPRLFRSRWAALLWAGGIVWMAVDIAGSAPHGTAHGHDAVATDAAGEPVDAADLAAVANALN